MEVCVFILQCVMYYRKNFSCKRDSQIKKKKKKKKNHMSKHYGVVSESIMKMQKFPLLIRYLKDCISITSQIRIMCNMSN